MRTTSSLRTLKDVAVDATTRCYPVEWFKTEVQRKARMARWVEHDAELANFTAAKKDQVKNYAQETPGDA